MYDDPANMPSDVRVDCVYNTTYMITGIIIYALTKYESVKNIPGLMDVLSKTICGCMGRGFSGHGFEYYDGFLHAMEIFAKSDINLFFEEYSGEFLEFKTFFDDRMPLLEDLAAGKIIGWFGENYSRRALAIKELLSRRTRPVRIFVYGTLTRGQGAHHYLENAKYAGEYMLPDYGMYDLGCFPGIKYMGSGHGVIGEVYEIDKDMLLRMDRYEGEGSLYNREEVYVYNASGTVFTYVYIYNGLPEGEPVIGRWGEMDKEYVWYACYGSNLSSDRFRCYIEGGTCKENGRTYTGCTSDKTLWKESKVKRFSGRMFFGNRSGSWGGKGVAFFENSGRDEVIMRMYKITKEQLKEVQEQEGMSMKWYGKTLCLGLDEDGCPIYTITNGERVPHNEPADNYVALIKKALVEECGISAGEAEEYIAGCMK